MDGFLQNNQPRCIQCPSNTICSKGTTRYTLKILPGYWRHSHTTLDIRECFQKQACIGGFYNISSDSMCRTGHFGP